MSLARTTSHSRLALALAGVIALAASACGTTGREEAPLPVAARGTAPAAIDVDGWSVTLSAAEVGVGPIYLCKSAASSADLCPSAVGELLEPATIDGLDPGVQALGDGEAILGESVRSVMFDYAITWLTTQTEPTPTAAAPGGHSLHLEGTAARDGVTFAFVADVDVPPRLRGSRAIEGLPLSGALESDALRLTIDVDPDRWVAAIDFQALADLGEDPVVIAADTPAYNAIAVAMTTRPPILRIEEDP